jgi:DNA-binding NarL/FixJ family response regulator
MAAVRVLIVDDVPEVRQDLIKVLNLVGEIYNTHPLEIVGEAADGLEAINQSISLQPDVVVMDLEMPFLDGFEAARQIKERCPACRIVALTVHDYSAARQRADQAGIDAFVVKGTPVEILAETISKR